MTGDGSLMPANCEIVTALPHLAPRAADGHKGTYGHVLIVAGSRGMSGAAILCAGGALRGGAGLVTVATPEPVQSIVSAAQPCALHFGLAGERRRTNVCCGRASRDGGGK